MKSTLASALAFAAVLCVGLMMPLPSGVRALMAITDLAHAPAFALLAVLVLAVCRQCLKRSVAWAAVAAWLLVAGFGCVAEHVQGFVGRTPSWLDLQANVMGAAAGICWVLGRIASSRRRRVGLTAVACLILLAPMVRPLYGT